ncbi:PLASTID TRANSCRIPTIONALLY ACTIVE protein 6, chloroplastic-like [Lolium rigidum]|uniref:PLASTID TRANSCRIPTIONALLY ACTIVE protein 6, chloroplastic-like n=1 Tax=Lolium rigidum TaxID=89674 RepID=UPI001F5D76B2|nr:PLASTID TRANSCRIPTIONALLY ACTIVE protein 6, chloroplastic-like [Lolium rigidum]
MATTPLATASPYPFPFLCSKTLNPTTTSKPNPPHALSLSLPTTPAPLLLPSGRGRRQRDVSAAYGDGDMDDDFGDAGDFDLDGDDGVGDDEDLDNEQDYDVDYDRLLAPVKPRRQLSVRTSGGGEEGEGDIAMVAADSFMSTGESAFDTVVDYTVDEDEFHKISLLHCDFFIRKVPDPDHDVYDFREMYVTPPDTDIYSIPRVLAPMPQKYVRCAKKNFGRYHVSEPPVEHMRDPLYKTEREIMKVFLTKHYRNRRFSDTDFFLDFEEIYVIDSKSRSITRAKVVVNVPEGKKRDRRNDLLLIRDGGDSFRVTDKTQRDDASTIIQREEWKKSRQDTEKHFRKLRDFDYSNWF